MSDAEVITTGKIIKKVPGILADFPSILKGIRISNNTDKTKSLGLGVAFENCVEANPDGLALIFEDQRFTYKQLNERVNQLSNYLIEHDLQKGDCVGIFIENRPELLISVLACAKIGAISAMLNTSQQGKVLAHSINLVEPSFILAGEECAQAYDEIRNEVGLDDNKHLYFYDGLQVEKKCPAAWLDAYKEIKDCSLKSPRGSRDIYSEDPCFYVYTSGTTGLPKAVIFNHGRFMKAYGAFGFAAVRLNKDDRMYVPLPFYHSTAMAVCWGSVLSGNACLIMARKFSVSSFWQDIRRHGATSFGYVGELCRYLMDQPEKINDLDNKVRVIVGNGMRPSIWNDFKARFGIERIMEFYASSEGNIGFTNLFNFNRTVGVSPYPYAIVQYDKESEEPIRNEKGFLIKVKKGEVGLLVGEITDKNPFHGYTDASKTESCILKDGLKAGDRWFNTGDLMRDMGFRHAQFVDRTGDTFRWKGENVSTTEVEMILEDSPGVQEAIVYGVEIPNTNGRAGMASLKLSKPLKDVNFKEVLSHLKQSLPAYAVPVFLSVNEDVKLTGTFKHVKGPLKDMGYDVGKNTQPVYVCLPNADSYVLLTTALQQEVDSGQYRY